MFPQKEGFHREAVVISMVTAHSNLTTGLVFFCQTLLRHLSCGLLFIIFLRSDFAFLRLIHEARQEIFAPNIDIFVQK